MDRTYTIDITLYNVNPFLWELVSGISNILIHLSDFETIFHMQNIS